MPPYNTVQSTSDSLQLVDQVASDPLKDLDNNDGFIRLDSAKEFFNEIRKHRMHLSTLVIWFFVFFILTFIVLYAWKPDGVQKYNKRGNPTGEVDAWKVVAASFVIAVLFTLVVFVLFGW